METRTFTRPFSPKNKSKKLLNSRIFSPENISPEQTGISNAISLKPERYVRTYSNANNPKVHVPEWPQAEKPDIDSPSPNSCIRTHILFRYSIRK